MPSVNVAVVFSGATYQAEIKGRLSRENFMDLPLEVNPITVLVNNTNPRTLLTRICDTLSTNRVHGIVFEDNVGSEAVAQILDFISTQTTVPIVGISGGSAVVLPHKVSEGLEINVYSTQNRGISHKLKGRSGSSRGPGGSWRSGGPRNEPCGTP